MLHEKTLFPQVKDLQCAHANQGQHFPLLLYFSFKESLFLAKMQFRRTAKANLGQHFRHMDETLFSQSTAHNFFAES